MIDRCKSSKVGFNVRANLGSSPSNINEDTSINVSTLRSDGSVIGYDGRDCGMMDRVVVIDDERYFFGLDGEIRKQFSAYEERELLPVVKEVWERAGVSWGELEEYPVEGYYYKTDGLRELFRGIRNLQQNKDLYSRVKVDGLVERLVNLYDSDIFGIPPVRSYPWPDAPLKRRWDILTSLMSDELIFDTHAHRPWSISSVMEHLNKFLEGKPNMVELAALVGKPICLTCAAESNALGRMFAIMTGSFSMGASYGKPRYEWRVSERVEELGKKIVNEYNQRMGKGYILLPTRNNMDTYPWHLPELPRVAHLGYLIEPKLNYFWIADECYQVFDYYTKDFITTENVYKKGLLDNFGRKAI